MLSSIALTFSVCLIASLGDALLDITTKNLYRALIDSFTHGLVGLFSWVVVLVSTTNEHIIINRIFEVLLSGFLASFVDVDHFIYNRSLDINSALQLGENRPLFHCTSLLLVSCAFPFIYSQVSGVAWLARLCWLTLLSVLSHHIRDATRRGLWLWPFGSTKPLPKPVYLGLLAALPHAVRLCVGILDKGSYTNFRNEAPHYSPAKGIKIRTNYRRLIFLFIFFKREEYNERRNNTVD